MGSTENCDVTDEKEATARMPKDVYDTICRDNGLEAADYFMGYKIVIDGTMARSAAIELYDAAGAYLGTVPRR